MSSFAESIDTLAGAGKAVMGGADHDIVEVVKLAIEAKRSVSFYLTRAQANEITAWYWTPERVRTAGIESISREEARRIQEQLGLKLDDFHYAPIECQRCSRIYGAFDFLQQGIAEHGSEAVQSLFSMENAMLLQVNPKFVPVCPKCESSLSASPDEHTAGFYFGSGYAACII